MTQEEKDLKELIETVELVQQNPNDAVILTIQNKDYVLILKEQFDNLINEINIHRMNISDKQDVELILPVTHLELEEQEDETK